MDLPVPNSPCINVCSLDGRGWCRGCYRTLDEIAGWPQMAADRKRAVLAATERRRQADHNPGART